MNRIRPTILALALLAGTGKAAQSTKIDFAKDIRPIFESRCHSCHGAEKQKGGLRLDAKNPALAGGDDGKAIIPGNSAHSLLVKKIASGDPEKVMPPKGERLTKAEITRIRQWIDQGAHWPSDDAQVARVESDHWAFQKITRPTPPNVKGRIHNPIDAFVWQRLQKEGLKPAPEADRYTLIRRLSLDLLGLPPTLEEVDQFVTDRSDNAYEALVDRLLASRHYGERWGRHWLDLARYADSDGYEKDRGRPYAYVFRDWVIKAVNDDLPFDQFSLWSRENFTGICL